MSLAVVLALGGMTIAPPAQAQSAAELAKARSQYKQGLSLEAAGDWGGALAKFEAVGKVKLTPQVRFHIARCKENLGRLNEALGDYRLAEYEAGQASAKELPEITKAREALEARIPKLVISRGEGAESARIELDGVELGEAKIGQEVSVDPGPHRIVAKLPKGQFEENVTLGEGESKTVDLVAPENLTPTTNTGPVTDPDVPPVEDKGVKVEKKGGSALPWIIGGVGVVGLAAGGYFFIKKNDAQSQLDDVCRGDVCPKSKQSLQDDGKQYATLTTVGLGVGVVGIGVATVMLLSSGGSDEPAKEQSKKGVRVDVASTSSYTGVNLVGRF
ncbi:MAG: hypothetical protein KC776_08235 [Myxococcales bacterium]|nr:hypothetical protein [Myxococcales bacterium]MCB9576788.1 hypothetical protein [Polyangiaceae bacterium]